MREIKMYFKNHQKIISLTIHQIDKNAGKTEYKHTKWIVDVDVLLMLEIVTWLACQAQMAVLINHWSLVDVKVLLMFEIVALLACQAQMAVLINHWSLVDVDVWNCDLAGLPGSDVGLAVDEQFRDIRICLIHPSGHSDIWISFGYQNPGPLSAVVLV